MLLHFAVCCDCSTGKRVLYPLSDTAAGLDSET